MTHCPHCKEKDETNKVLAEQNLRLAEENRDYEQFVNRVIEILEIKEVDHG